MSSVVKLTDTRDGSPEAKPQKKSCTFICSRNTIDGAYPALLLAINARRMGMDATIFYTFMGLDLVKKGGAEKCQFIPQGTLGAIPGMASMATAMMKRKIDGAGIPTVAELMEMAPLEGVKLVACKMTMDMLGLTKADLIDAADVQTAEQYMKFASGCQINMFT